MSEQIDTNMNIDIDIFHKFKQYLVNKSQFAPKVFNSYPRNLTVFPTITFREQSNIEGQQATTLDRLETTNIISYTIEIYVKDMVINEQKFSKKQILDELKYLVFDFFQSWGFIRTQAMPIDYINYEVDRYVITEICTLNNWNRKINL